MSSTKKKNGCIAARELIADINRYTKLEGVFDTKIRVKSKPSLLYSRTLFDSNEHFIELSNMGADDRSTTAMLILMPFLVWLLSLMPLGFGIYEWVSGIKEWYINVGAGFLFVVLVSCFFIFLIWPTFGAPVLFTSLRARYRFNRTTRKVYVLRPKRYGGNVILDWDRVQAHPTWCAPREMKHNQINDPSAREARQKEEGGPGGLQCLLLYWPADEASGQKEEILWVGPRLSGQPLWHYIWTFMERGPEAVRPPNEYEWLRKGRHSLCQYVYETATSGTRTYDALTREGKSSSLWTQAMTLAEFIWAPWNWLLERTCYWPTFPPEWNSDCGQLRREDGIGPEEPLHWTPRNLDGSEITPLPSPVPQPLKKEKAGKTGVKDGKR